MLPLCLRSSVAASFSLIRQSSRLGSFCSPHESATYAYVNPVVAVLLGHLVLSEPFGPRVLVSAAIILAGVVITTLPQRTTVD